MPKRKLPPPSHARRPRADAQRNRERILQVAKELGYAPDARLVSWMARLQAVKSKNLLPIAWLNTCHEKNAWHCYRFQSPVLEGAQARAKELGYYLEEIWTQEPDMTMRQISKILYQRAIEGVIITHPARHFRLDWDHLASVSIGAIQVPKMHRILPDIHANLILALKSLRKLGYRRIGICLDKTVERGSLHTVHATADAFYSSISAKDRVPPLFHPLWWTKGYNKETKLIAWLKRHKPEVIVGHDNHIEQWVKAAGFRVPEDLGIVHLSVDDDVLDWAGVYSRRRDMGATAVEWLVSLMRNHQFGLPRTPLNIFIQGTWQTGRTIGTVQ